MGVHGGSYFCALHAYYRAQTLTIEAAPDSSLARAARLAAARSYSSIAYGPDTGRLIACKKEVCSEPVRAAEDLPAEFTGVLVRRSRHTLKIPHREGLQNSKPLLFFFPLNFE